jgi:hypothetical protein
MKRESEKHKRMIESVRLREENETLKERIKDLQKKNRELNSTIQRLDYQGNMDGFKVNYQWGKFKYYTEKLDNLITEMKGKIGDEAEENEYEIFLKERTEKK